MARGALVIRDVIRREPSYITKCIRCGATFTMVGSTPIRLGMYRPAKRGKNGSERTGTCPVHRQMGSGSLPSNMFP